MTRALILILGDQLSHDISALKGADASQDKLLMCEVMEEASYVKHHKKKIAFLFSAMRHFAEELREKGWSLHYTKLGDAENTGSFNGEVARMTKRLSPQRIIVTHPGEHRVLQATQRWEEQLGIPVEIREDDRFFCSTKTFNAWAKDKKQLRMEFFYREMRKQYAVLMGGDKPIGGKWNYDAENRKPPKEGLKIPEAYHGQQDTITEEVMEMVSTTFADHFGDLEPFYFAVTRDQALYCLKKFIDERLPDFGTYQDAMIEGEPWMYHSHISFYLNCGLLNPRECVAKAEDAYRAGIAPLNAVEGFIRQILGWREYVRGIYWLNMPEYESANALNAKRALPWLFWSGETQMNCMKQCIKETKENAYAHHIQRLMVLGNFALLAGIHPREMNEWYLVVYADAYEWVEMPNVTGMILFADAGYLASKPYAAGGNYISKMSNYCENCRYNVKEKTGETACPFNYLYWDFLARHEQRFASNPRMIMVYKTYQRMDEEKKGAIRHSAKTFLKRMDANEKV